MCGGGGCGTPHMQAYLPGPSSSSSSSSVGGRGGGGILLASRRPSVLLGLSSFHDGWSRRADGRRGSVAEAVGGGQDHYDVLGVPKGASSADVKRAYRLLARKYHPDVSNDSQAGELFKSIRVAYEVLSDEGARAQYDREIKVRKASFRSHQRNWTYDPEFDEKRRTYRWRNLELRIQYERHQKEGTIHGWTDAYKESSDYERGPFGEVLWFAFFLLFLAQTFGCRISLALCGLNALFDQQLDAGYKMGYAVACFLGGQVGILLMLCIRFASWLCGKNSSSLVALVVLAMWVGTNLASLVPLPQGAVLTLLYMSIKLQVDLR